MFFLTTYDRMLVFHPQWQHQAPGSTLDCTYFAYSLSPHHSCILRGRYIRCMAWALTEIFLLTIFAVSVFLP